MKMISISRNTCLKEVDKIFLVKSDELAYRASSRRARRCMCLCHKYGWISFVTPLMGTAEIQKIILIFASTVPFYVFIVSRSRTYYHNLGKQYCTNDKTSEVEFVSLCESVEYSSFTLNSKTDLSKCTYLYRFVTCKRK